jgi:hypothetical protein
MWDAQDHILAGIFDALVAANYQRGGAKGARPTPLKRPGQGPRTYGKAIPIEEARERLRRRKLGLPA